MTIYRGNKKVIGIYRGTSKVVKVYDGGDVIFEPELEIKNTNVIAKYNIKSTTSKTQICNKTVPSAVTAMYIDGVEVRPVSAYTFSTTGEHTVEYDFIDKENLGVSGQSNSYGYFNNCDTMFDIYIPDTYTYLGVGTFQSNDGITNVNFLPKKLKTIDNSAFYQCKNITSVTIPDSVTSLGTYAFSSCSGLTSIEIPDGVTSIGNFAFQNCKNLTSVTIPDSVTNIGSSAFQSCSGLTSIELPANITEIKSNTFNSCNALTSVTIPHGVTTIGQSAFYQCKNITSVTIPDSVKSIGFQAFWDCKNLTSIELPDGVTSIGYGAFHNTSLTSIEIPASVTSISDNAFAACNGLTSITVDINNTYFNDGNGSNCIIQKSSNTLIQGCSVTVIPEGVTSIGNGAFAYYSSLTSITIPNSVTSIGDGAFTHCSGLKEITCNATTAPAIKLNSIFSIRKNSTLYYPCESDYASWLDILVGEYEWTDSCGKYVPPRYQIKVTYVGTKESEIGGVRLISTEDSVLSAYSLTENKEYLVHKCYDYANQIKKGETLVMLYTLKNYESKVKVPNNLLAYTTAVKVSLSDDYTEFGYGAFADCQYLTDVYIYGSPSDWNTYSDFMSNTRNGGTFHVKRGYESEFEWLRDAQYTWNIVGDIDSSSTFNPELTDEDTEINVSVDIPTPDGAQMMATYTNDAFDLYNSGVIGINTMWINGEEQFPDAHRTVTENDVVHFKFDSDSIPNDMFKGTSLQSVVIYDSISSIGDYAFSDCTKLMNIEIPDSVTNIWSCAFYNCNSLTSVTIGSGIVSIGDYAFANCTSLSSTTCKAITEPSIKSETFNNVYYGGTLYYPSGSYYATWLSNGECYLGWSGWMGDYII